MYTYLLLIVFCLNYEAKAVKVLRPKFGAMKLWNDEKFCTHTIDYDENEPQLNFTLEVLQEIRDLDVHLEMHFINKQDAFYMASMNTSLNLCRIINWYSKSVIGSLIRTFMHEHGKLIETCPIAVGHYNMHKIWWAEDTSYTLLQEADFNVIFSAYRLDEQRQRTLVINDHFMGELIVQEVNNIKPGILAFLPKIA